MPSRLDEVLTTRRSKLFVRRAAVRNPQVVPTQPPSDLPETVAQEKAMAIALAERVPRCIERWVNDLCISAAEPSTDTLNALASGPAPVDGIAVPESVATEIAAAPDVVTSAPPTKGQKRGRKPEKSVSGAPRQRRASRKRRGVEESSGGAEVVGAEPENMAGIPQK